ncbi:carbohydrate ABC transporter substrate-binding protein [Paenibacillus albiflavus]|uniref:Carbohydrate ABC transporter substrate-binding protein n=1 Tax=Paenibacillus albiflavus TaxID=2545760 RepID=A0A4R4E9R1_9BACL|nr:ABC transporter substrate-binding protein [Paenibacillus albiflavus]TCZ76594.1 carbohydrate ABC transporter substrate-binding protein [Paenibacillus albiflavus]
MIKRNLLTVSLTIILFAIMMTACAFNGQEAKPVQERTLRIATSEGFGEDDEYFRMKYTNIFEYNHPNIHLEIMDTHLEEDPFHSMLQLMEGADPPDVVMLNANQMSEMLEKNLLSPLDSRLVDAKYDFSNYVPAVYEGIRNLSPDGQIYAMAPLFNSSALLYNKQIFDDAGVPYPHDNMTWDETFELARRISSKQDGKIPIYGFSFNPQRRQDTFSAMRVYTDPLQLNYVNATVDAMTVDNGNWEKAWNTVYQLQEQGITPPVHDPNNLNPLIESLASDSAFPNDYFKLGLLGMTIISYDQLNRLIDLDAHADQIPNYSRIDWDVATIPCHPEYPGAVSNVELQGLMAINTRATNPQDAWSFIRFINSPTWAKIKIDHHSQLSAYKQVVNSSGRDYHVEAFCNIKPIGLSSGLDEYRLEQINPTVTEAVDLGRTELRKVMLGKQSTKDGLKAWQEQGNDILRQ